MGDQPVSSLVDTDFPGEWGEANARSGLLECRVLRSTNLTPNGIDYSTAAKRYVPDAKARGKRLRRGDLILEAAGGGPGVPVGRVARFDPPDGEGIYLVSNFFRTLRPARDTDSRFVCHILQYLYQQPRIWQVQQQTTGIINLNIRGYLQFRIPVCPLEEQRRIAEVLDTIDETIQATERVIAKRRALRAGLAADLLKPPNVVASSEKSNGTMRSPASTSTSRSWGMGEWREQPLGSLVTFEYGAALGAASRTGSGFCVYGSNGVVGRHDIALVSGPGIIVGRKGSVGALKWSECDFWPIDTTYWVKPKVDLDLRWMREALRLVGLERLDSSTGVPGLNRGDAYERSVPVPPLEEQRRIAEILDTANGTVQRYEAELVKLGELRAGIAADLLSGRVRTVAL